MWETIPIDTYLPIIVKAICNDGHSIIVSDISLPITTGDILVTSAKKPNGSWNLHVTDVVHISDIFEDYLILDISAINNAMLLWAVKDFVNIGDELKILGNAH